MRGTWSASAQRAVDYCADRDREQFETNELLKDAVVRNLKLAHSEISWRQIIAMRNQLIHAYLGVDLDVVWDVVKVGLPLLIQQLKAVIG